MKEIKYSSSIIEIIKKRESWRSYEPVPLVPDIKIKIENVLTEDLFSPFTGNVRFKLIETLEINSNEKKQLGTYGFIKGAIYYLVGVMRESKFDLEDFGFKMEQLILYATDLGLSTCWIGGTLRRNNFANQIKAQADEVVPAISPVGYAAKNSFVGKLTKWGARSKKRLPWSKIFFEGVINTPLMEKKARKYVSPLEMVRLAPSASNRQPWRIVKEKNEDIFHFFLCQKKKKRILRRTSFPDFPRIDIGIATSHFDLVIKELGLKGEWKSIQTNSKVPNELQYVITWIAK
ncbi:MAG: nitroreductase family protein [Candidatus Hodarchaeota archaeon]